jgi:uncharacterized membrane protein (DUF2068 family)
VIALFEAFKGFVVLALALGLLSFLMQDNEAYAEQIVRRLHIDPGQYYAHMFIRAMADEPDSQLVVWAMFATLYAAVRGAEAYGLWHSKRWAEWFAAFAGGIYIPIEIYELFRRVTWLKISALIINIAIVAYMVWLLTESRRLAAKAALEETKS